MIRTRAALVAVLMASAACWSAQANILPIAQAPQLFVQDLIDTDRGFATAASGTTAIPAVLPMFAADVIVQGPTGLIHGLEDVTTALKANAVNATAKLTWAPVRGGVSADATHGFTLGYMTLTHADGTVVPVKYLAYWIRRDGQWRVAAYKRRVRAAGEVSTTMLPPSLPERMNLSADGSTLMSDQRSLAAAEKAFSDEAQLIGLGPAFAKHGWPDAMHIGGPNDVGFVVGNEAIGRSIGLGAPGPKSPVFWSAEDALVAPGGDLGVTFGRITPHPKPGEPPPPSTPFFTIWRRIGGVWKYIAE